MTRGLAAGCRVVRRALAVGLMPVAAWLAAGPAEAQDRCAPRDAVLRALADRYGEAPVAMGLGHGGGLVEVLVSGATGSWTIIVTRPDGVACMLATGEMWEGSATAPPGDPA